MANLQGNVRWTLRRNRLCLQALARIKSCGVTFQMVENEDVGSIRLITLYLEGSEA